MRKIDLILLFKNFLSQEGRKQEDYSDEIKDFLEYLNEKHNHFNHKNDEMSPEVYIEIGDFIEAEDIKLIIIKLTDLFIQFDNESENKLCKNDVIEKIKLFQRIVSDKFQKNPSNNEHIQLLLEKITLNIQLKSIQSVNASNFSPHTIIFVSTNTFNSLSEDFAKRIYYNNKTHAKNPKYPSEEEFVNNWHLKKIGLVQFISKKDLQNELIILPENSRCIIITDCLNWNKGNSKLVNLKNQNNEYILSQIKNFCFIKTDSPQINQNFLQEAKNKKVGVFNFNSIINIQSKSQRTTLNSSIKRNFKVQEFIKKRNPKRYLTNVLLPPSMSFYVPQIIFIDGNINLWNEYYQICIDFEIPYLVSIQFRNLLNVCFTYEIGDEIISCLKSQNSSINLPASFSEQWQSLNDIQKEELLKSLKVLICDIVNIHGNIYHNFEKSTRILVPKLVYESEKLKVKISKFLKIKKEHIINWGSDYSRGKIISFDYRDIGIIKYPIKPPNIFETNHLQISDVCLVSYLFENKLHFGQYNFNNLIINELDNEYRRDKFKWEDLINEVKKIKPKNIDKTDYEFEEKVQREIEMDYYEVKFTHNGKVFKRQFNEYSKFLVNDTCGYEIEDLEGIKNKESI